MYDFAAEPGNNELTVNEGEIITITNPVRVDSSGCPLCGAFLFLSSSAHVSASAVAYEMLMLQEAVTCAPEFSPCAWLSARLNLLRLFFCCISLTFVTCRASCHGS